MKVRTRMMLAFLLAGILSLVYLISLIENKLKPVYKDPIEDDLVEMATLLSSSLTLSAENGEIKLGNLQAMVEHAMNRQLNAQIYDRKKDKMELHIYVTDAEGTVIYDSHYLDVGEVYANWHDVKRTLQGEYGARATWLGEKQDRLFYYVASPVMVDGELKGVLSVGKSTAYEAYKLLNKMNREALIGVIGAVMVGIIMAVLFTMWVTRPIRQLTEYAGAVRDGRPTAFPELARSDIGQLGRSFEEMREALEGRKYVEQYVQTLTHEIKSPLSAIKGAAELLEEDMPESRRASFLHNIQTETHRIQRIVDRLLELSAMENRKGLRNVTQISLTQEIKGILAAMNPVIESKQIKINLLEEEDNQLMGESFLIRQALSNIIHNAIDFTPPKGHITIRVAPGEVSVQDNGPGIPQYALSRVFERFYSLQRPDSGRKSSGLGLSIVQRVTELHGGSASLTNGPEGGALAVVTFKNSADKPAR